MCKFYYAPLRFQILILATGYNLHILRCMFQVQTILYMIWFSTTATKHIVILLTSRIFNIICFLLGCLCWYSSNMPSPMRCDKYNSHFIHYLFIVGTPNAYGKSVFIPIIVKTTHYSKDIHQHFGEELIWYVCFVTYKIYPTYIYFFQLTLIGMADALF